MTLSETEVLQSVLRVLGFKVWDGLRQNLEFRLFLEIFFFFLIAWVTKYLVSRTDFGIRVC